MENEFQPLMMKDLKIEVSGNRIHRVALNRHMPKVERVKMHRHEKFDQLLLYLRGSGTQTTEHGMIPVRRGSLLCFRRGTPHGFLKERNISPLCVSIELQFGGSVEWPNQLQVPAESLQRIEQTLHGLAKLNPTGSPFASAAGVLVVISELEGLPGKSRSGPVSQRVKKWIDSNELKQLRPASIAEGLGQNIDYLNRQLKREADTSVGRILAGVRFEEACRLLKTDLSIGEVAMEIGFYDQNYFSRWFRKQSGVPPSQFR